MKLRLVKAGEKYRRHITEMMDEWVATGETIVPYAIRVMDYHDFEQYCAAIEVSEPHDDLVPSSTFFCLDEDRDRWSER